MNKKFIVLLIIISLLIGFGVGTIFEKGIWQLKLAQTQKELDSLKSQMETIFPPLPEEIYTTFGTVTEVGDKFLVMEAQIRVSQFPLPEGKDYERRNIKVNLTEETKIFWLENPGPSSLGKPLEPQKVPLSFGDIKVGNQIFVTAKENIKDKNEITATEIQIIY